VKNNYEIQRRILTAPNVFSVTEETKMRTNTNPTTLCARALRQTASPAEQCLWNALKGRQLAGYKFTRQYPIGPYFVDFACRSQGLLIDIVGSKQGESDFDQKRDAYLLDEGYSVVRVPAASVLRERDAVCASILAALQGRLEDFVEASEVSFKKNNALAKRRRVQAHNPSTASHMAS
jgi:very-short-patch-repair endonuclease